MVLRRIVVDVVDHASQRYATAGDWQFKGEELHISVSRTGEELDPILVAVHELVEAVLCRHRGISQELVDSFDMAFDGDGEPGEQPSSPYRKEHAAADVVERFLALEIGLNWQEYSDRIDSLFKEEVKA